MPARAARLAQLTEQNAALRAELALYRDALEHMHQGLCMFDADGRIVLCNPRYAEIQRLPTGSIRPGMTGAEVVRLGVEAGHYPPGRTPEEIGNAIRAQIRSGAPSLGTMVRDGHSYTVNQRSTSSGYLVTTCEDITAQIEAERALRQSEQQLRAMLDAMPDCVKIFDESGTLVHINPAGLELLQAPDAAALSTPGYVPVPPEYRESCLDVHQRVIAGESIVWIYEVIGLEGRRRHVEAHAVPFRLPGGGKAQLCISRDIDERQQSHEAVRRSEERLRLVHEATGLADFEARSGAITQFSDTFIQQTGLPAGTKRLTTDQWMEIVHPDDREDFKRCTTTSTERGDTAQFEFRIVRPDNGQIRWIHSTTQLRRDAAGNPVTLIGAHLDITERRLAEEALRTSEERLRLVQEATGVAEFEFDAKGYSIYSDRYFEQLGLPIGDSSVVSKGCIDFVHPDDRDRILREIAAAHEQRRRWSYSEFRIIRADNGATRWIACSTKMERDERGDLIRMIGGHLDITERKEAEEALRLSEKRLRLVQEVTGLAHFEAGPDGISQFSERFLEQAGLPAGTSSISPQAWNDIVHLDDRERFIQTLANSQGSQDTVECEFRIVRPDNGQIRWLYSRCKVDRDTSGVAYRFIGAHLDITERKRAEEALRESEERFRLAAEAAGLGVWDYDLAQDRREWSDRLRQIFGIGLDVQPSREVAAACIHPAERAQFGRMMHDVCNNRIGRFEETYRIHRASDGAERWVTMNGWRTFKSESKLGRIIVTVRDVTEEKTAEQLVRWTASHDTLTGIANRSLFSEALDTAIGEAGHAGGTVGLLLLDLDGFKHINDTLGHDAGDTMLKLFARRLRAVVREGDTVARLGGDEFAVVLPDIDGAPDLMHLSRSIQQRLREPFADAGRLLDCRVSMGASVFPVHGSTSAELLKNADIALYAAKAAGRASLTMYEPRMRDGARRRAAMVELARCAIRDDRIVPYYQPKLDLATRRLIGFEALLRWRRSNGKIAPPSALEAAFEDLEVAAQLSDRMIERVVADVRHWLDRGVPFEHVAINASAAELRRDDFAERLLASLRGADVPARCIQLEVTETVFLGRGAEYVHRALALLSARGVKIALDDFGTGYASLRHLKQFPVDIIKIDQSFVRDMNHDPGDEAIVRAVVNLGRSLGIKVVAEGIETESQAKRLIQLHCDFGQGFLFSRAVAASRVPAVAAHWGAPARPSSAGSRLRLVASRV